MSRRGEVATNGRPTHLAGKPRESWVSEGARSNLSDVGVGMIRVRCALSGDDLRILERRLNWWTERLVDSSEPIRWHLTAWLGEDHWSGVEAVIDELDRRRDTPKQLRVRWELLLDGAEGDQIAAVITGTITRHAIRRARLAVRGTDITFATRLARELSHSRWQLRRLPLPRTPISTASDLLAACTPIEPTVELRPIVAPPAHV